MIFITVIFYTRTLLKSSLMYYYKKYFFNAGKILIAISSKLSFSLCIHLISCKKNGILSIDTFLSKILIIKISSSIILFIKACISLLHHFDFKKLSVIPYAKLSILSLSPLPAYFCSILALAFLFSPFSGNQKLVQINTSVI